MINDQKLFDKIDFHPFKEQLEIINSKAKIKFVACGWRFGKTLLASYLALKTLLLPNKVVWVVAPSYQLTEMIYFNVLRWMIKLINPKYLRFSTRPTPVIRLPWGSILEGKSSENRISLQGKEVDLIVVDEAASQPEWIEEELHPRIVDRDGSIIYISTPKGKNWFYHGWLREKKNGGSFQYPSIVRPNFPKNAWEDAKKRLPESVFNQNYMAMFVDSSNSVFYSKDIEAVINKNAFENPVFGETYVMGVDLGKHNDWTVLTVIKKSQNRVVFIERTRNERYPYQKERIKTVSRNYNRARIIIDSTGLGEPIYDDLFDEGLLVDDFKFTRASKEKLIDKLRIFIQEKTLILPPFQPLIDELKAFEKTFTKDFNVKYHAPSGGYDDCVDSLALAVWGLETSPASSKNMLKKQLMKAKTERIKMRRYFSAV